MDWVWLFVSNMLLLLYNNVENFMIVQSGWFNNIFMWIKHSILKMVLRFVLKENKGKER